MPSAYRLIRPLFIGATLVAGSLGVHSAFADQQKWAAAYTYWKFDPSIDVWNIDQEVWMPAGAPTSYWPMEWNWKGATTGGYLGLQQGDNGQDVRFSLWNATEAKGSACQTFGGEGIGYTCTLPVTIDPAKFYRLRLWKTAAANDGQWWGAWLIETGPNGTLVQHPIGEIKVGSQYQSVDPNSIMNFSEYWGSSLPRCDGVPMSVVGLTPPAVNYHGTGTGVYGGYSQLNSSSTPAGNVCKTGAETQGALTRFQPYDFGFAKGTLVFLGGKTGQQTLDPKSHPTPPDMPNS